MRTVVASRVRDARVTDVGPITALLERTGSGGPEVADLLRSLVYLPNATVLVAVDGRRTLGTAVLSLRPSVREGGLIGTIDLLAVADGDEGPAVAQELVSEALRSARNKGCVLVEGPEASSGTDLWSANGFMPGATRPVHHFGVSAGGRR